MNTQQNHIHGEATEAYGSRTLYGVIVAGAAFLLVASLSAFGPANSAQAEQHTVKAPTTIETIVATPGQST